GDDRAMVVVLDNLGWVDMLQGDNRAARACFEEAMAIARRLRIDDRIGGLLRWLGLLARDQGNFEQAWRLLEESDAVARRLGDRGLSALTHYTMGLLARAQGDRGRARACAQASLSMARDIGATLLQISGIGLVGILAIAGGAHQQGVRLLARSGPGPTGGWWYLPDELQTHQESVLAARTALGERGFT